MRNLRLALRALTKQPLFTAIVIITFALGIGANTAVFSVLNAVVLRPLEFHEPQNLVELELDDMRLGPESGQGSAASYPDFQDWRAQNQGFSRVAVYTNQNLTLTDGERSDPRRRRSGLGRTVRFARGHAIPWPELHGPKKMSRATALS